MTVRGAAVSGACGRPPAEIAGATTTVSQPVIKTNKRLFIASPVGHIIELQAGILNKNGRLRPGSDSGIAQGFSLAVVGKPEGLHYDIRLPAVGIKSRKGYRDRC